MTGADAVAAEEVGPFIDVSGDVPTAVNERQIGGRCHGSSAGDGKCEAMDLSFDSIEEWREHRNEHHPVACNEDGCSTLSAYKRDNAPRSYCYEHIPDDPETVYAWKRVNTASVVAPPRAPDDHPIEAALPDTDEEEIVTDGGECADGVEHDAKVTGDAAEGKLLLCTRCCRFREVDRDGEPQCSHSFSEATDTDELDEKAWRYAKLLAYHREREQDRLDDSTIAMAVRSIVADLAFAGEDVPDPDETDRLEDLAGGDGE